MAKRGSHFTVNTDVDLYVDDVLHRCDDEDLIQELKKRRSNGAALDLKTDEQAKLLDDLLEAWRDRDEGLFRIVMARLEAAFGGDVGRAAMSVKAYQAWRAEARQ